MPISIFLAKVIGLYFVIVSLILLIKPEQFRDYALSFLKNKVQLLPTALFTLILGILMVISHNIWVYEWRVWITLISWLVLVKGVLLLFNPSWFDRFVRSVYENGYLRVFAVIYLVVGLLFCWKGFF